MPNPMSAKPNDIARVWDILEKNSTGMLTTRFSGGLRARPLDARPDRDAGAIFFLTDARRHKDDEIAAKTDEDRQKAAQLVDDLKLVRAAF